MRQVSATILAILGLTFATTLPADAAGKGRRTIALKGKIPGAGGYRLIALGRQGKSTVATVGANGAFRLDLKKDEAKRATLHLVASSGQYVGPLLLARGTRAVTTLAGTKSGNLRKLTLQNGFVTAPRKAAALFKGGTVPFDPVTGAPGTGKLGLVASVPAVVGGRRVAPAEGEPPAPGDDADGDGLPNAIDVDDDGDLVLDSIDPDYVDAGGGRPYAFTDLVASVERSINANAANVTQAHVDDFLRNALTVVFGYNTGGDGQLTTVNVDCAGLPYCGPGGSGTIVGVGGLDDPPDLPIGALWSTYDPDGDGFPNLYLYPSGTRAEVILKPAVTTSEIGAGDAMIFTSVRDGATERHPLVLSFVFVTVPAVTAWSDGTTGGTIAYPGTTGGPGSPESPIALGSTSLTLTFWRPQRPAVEGAETSPLVDMGGLRYGVGLSVGSTIITCQPADFSNLSPTLTAVPSLHGEDVDVLLDGRSDAAPSATETLALTVDLAACISRAGVSPSGATVLLGLTARDRANNNALQQLLFTVP